MGDRFRNGRAITPFRCRRGAGGHILGMVVKDEAGVPQLLLLRNAILDEADFSPEVDVMGMVDGLSEFKCSVCGRIRTWMPGPEALQRIVDKMKRRELEE